MGKGSMVWNSAADQKLLLAILATHDIKLNYDAVAAIFGPHCTARAVHERIKKLKIMAKEDDDSSPDSTPTKSTAAAKKAAVPKSKANAKSKGPDGNVQTPKKRKTNNAGIAATKTDSGEGVEKGEPVLGDKRKINEILVSDDGNDGHTPVKEEPPNFDGDSSDISIFDPAEDQLLAEHDASLNAI